MTDEDLALVRDEIGDQPDDTTIAGYFEELDDWRRVALRVLKRRRATAAAGGQQTKSFSLDGVLSVGLSTADFRTLDAQIARLEALLDGGVVTTGRVTRPDRYR